MDTIKSKDLNMNQVSYSKFKSVTKYSINSWAENAYVKNKGAFKKALKAWFRRNALCLCYVITILSLVGYFYFTQEELIYTYTDPSAFIPEPESFAKIDEFLLNQ